jgi:exosortase E/protease (VPEID-CTERM system)
MPDAQESTSHRRSYHALALICVVFIIEGFWAIVGAHPRFGAHYYLRELPFVFLIAVLVLSSKKILDPLAQASPRYLFLSANVLFFLGFLFAGRELAHLFPDGANRVDAWYAWPLVIVWFALSIGSILSLIAVVMPLVAAARLARSLGLVWLYAALFSLLSLWVRSWASNGWDLRTLAYQQRLELITFHSARYLLSLFYPMVYSDPRTKLLGTANFVVVIKGVCSGVEGMFLIALLTVAWLIFARRELRLERGILLIPIAIVLMWCLNLGRLVLLIAIGNAGHPGTAINGFHSAAGWISFNLVSAAFLLIANRIRWFRNSEREAQDSSEAPGYGWRNVPAIYLAPFLVIVASSFLSLATTGGFEWLYPLRFVAALLVLWVFRNEYRAIDWRGGWVGVAGGVVVAVLWLLVRLKTHVVTPEPDVTRMGLAELSRAARYGWIAVRVVAACTTVPVAEELAFRGFVARRVTSSDVETAPYRDLSIAGIAVSSVLFGALHGEMWLMGIFSGVVFALVAKLRGRLGEAVVAHAVANFLIAVVALRMHNYALW